MPPNEDHSATRAGWHQQDIQAEIRKRGSTVTELSRRHGLHRGTLQSAFYKRYPKGQAIIAEFLNRTRHELWPGWYGPEDELLPLEGRRHVVRKVAA